MNSLHRLCRTITGCRKCPRLVRWRQRIAREKTARFSDWSYWGKPVPGFGDPGARLLLVGLAPAAHGANRTGRMFTGDRSGDWLYRALFKAGFANQPSSTSREDGLRLRDCFVSAACRCAPPQNKPLRNELEACRPFLIREATLLPRLRIVVGLGRIGFEAAYSLLRTIDPAIHIRKPVFRHGAEYPLPNNMTLIASFHPSQQNTFTGRLTEPMFDRIFATVRRRLKST